MRSIDTAGHALATPGPAAKPRAARTPGPKGRPLVGSLPELKGDPLSFLAGCAREFGDVSSFRVLGFPVFLFAAPPDVECILATKSGSFAKGRGLRAGNRLFGRGLLTSEGELWRRQRKLAQPAFHRERVAGYAEVMTELAEERAGRWRSGETRDLHDEMMSLTLAIVGRTLFSTDVTGVASDVGEALKVALEEFPPMLNPLRRVLAGILPTPRNLRLKRSVERLDRLVNGIIAGRRRSGRDAGDLLSMLLAARDEEGRPMSDRQLRDEAMTLFLAGHETTAIAITWALYLLSQDGAAQERLGLELDAVLAGRPAAFADLEALPFASAVVREAMRLYPPAWAVGRLAVEDVEIGATLVPKGASVLVSPWVTHRDPRLYREPERFVPDRWLDGEAPRLPRFAYFPFGGGPRVCIGSAFAHAEAVLVLAAIARRFRVRLAPGQEIGLWPSVTLRPRHGMRVVLEAR